MINQWANSWMSILWGASWQGALACGLVWMLCAVPGWVAPRVRCWLWRLVAVKFLLGLIWVAPVQLPVLPGHPVNHVVAMQTVEIMDAPEKPPPSLTSVVPVAAVQPFSWRTILAGFWIGGVIFGVVRLAVGWRKAQRLGAGNTVTNDVKLLGVRDRLCQRMEIARPPSVAVSERISSPMLVGMIHPIILLPTDLSADSIEMVLAHELAHLSRRDLWWGWLTALTTTIFFFHPFAWLMRYELRAAEEAACDAQALYVTGKEPAMYGQMLLTLATGRSGVFQRQLSVAGIVESAASLRRRLRLLARAGEMSRRGVVISAMCTLLIALAGLIPWRLVPRTLAADDATRPVAADTTQPLSITGRVLTADGKPAIGATVWAIGARSFGDMPRVSNVSVASDGAFSLVPPSRVVSPANQNTPARLPQGNYFAEAPGVGVSQVELIGTDNAGPLQLLPATALHLTLIKPEGAPAAGIKVNPYGMIPPGGNQARGVLFTDAMKQEWAVTTDAGGNCVLTGLPRGCRLLLDINDDAYATEASPTQAIQLAADPVDTATVRLMPAGDISGNLVIADSGQSAAGMKLILVAMNGQGRIPGLTDMAGHYDFKRLRPGSFSVNLDDALMGRILSTSPLVLAPPLQYVAKAARVDLAQGESKQTDLKLVHGALITGKIRDKTTATGIANVNVMVNPDLTVAMADGNGVYSVRVLPGAKTLQVILGAMPQYQRSDPNQLRKTATVVEGDSITENFDLAPDHSHVVEGKVVDAAGNPVAGALIDSAEPGGTRYGMAARTRTDADGHFQLQVAPGSLLRARAGGMATAAPVATDASGEPVTLQISSGNTYNLAATVTDEQGVPIPGINVMVMASNRSLMPNRQAVSGADGTAHFDAIPTDLDARVFIQADAYGTRDMPIPVSAPHEQQTMTLALQHANSTIAGVVVDDHGAPAANVTITLRFTPDDYISKKTDAEGRFSFAVLDGATGTITLPTYEITPQGGTVVHLQTPVNVKAGQTNLALTYHKPPN